MHGVFALKTRGDELWETKKYKDQHTCIKIMMNRDHSHLDVRYILPVLKGFVRAEVPFSVSVIHLISYLAYPYKSLTGATYYPSASAVLIYNIRTRDSISRSLVDCVSNNFFLSWVTVTAINEIKR